jgi:hypothetical protein
MKTGGIFKIETSAGLFCCQLQYADIIRMEAICCGDVLFRRRYVTEMFWMETFCAEKFCMCAVFLSTMQQIFFKISFLKECHTRYSTLGLKKYYYDFAEMGKNCTLSEKFYCVNCSPWIFKQATGTCHFKSKYSPVIQGLTKITIFLISTFILKATPSLYLCKI